MKEYPQGSTLVLTFGLPPPDQLVLKEETVKVTLALTKESVDFFKEIAREKVTVRRTTRCSI
ncbi:MAG: hypothetical protein H0U70_09240 [Tatlockia sp.]|nr:hypothetical protein [Tatlockia sp.]